MTVHNWVTSDQVNHYLMQLGDDEPEVLRELREETSKHRMAKMTLSFSQIQLLSWLLKLINAKHYLELGVFTGYSSTAAALALPPDGTVTACDINVGYTNIARSFWQKANVTDKITLHLQPALITLDELLAEGKESFFDFILIDADKPTTPDYYERCVKLLRIGGIIMIDNILLGGRVIPKPDEDTKILSANIAIMRQFNQQIKMDNRICPLALPMGDGTILLKKLTK